MQDHCTAHDAMHLALIQASFPARLEPGPLVHNGTLHALTCRNQARAQRLGQPVWQCLAGVGRVPIEGVRYWRPQGVTRSMSWYWPDPPPWRPAAH
eukprot:scaffold2544_cov401-Prasinococcus_capsulatus_cf.AAC.5